MAIMLHIFNIVCPTPLCVPKPSVSFCVIKSVSRTHFLRKWKQLNYYNIDGAGSKLSYLDDSNMVMTLAFQLLDLIVVPMLKVPTTSEVTH